MGYASVDEYLKRCSPEARAVLQHMQRAILEVIPGAEQVISYQIPCFKVEGRYIVYIAAWKHHVSMYPVPAGDDAFAKAIAPYRASKGTVRFALDKPIPLELVKQFTRFRLEAALAQ